MVMSGIGNQILLMRSLLIILALLLVMTPSVMAQSEPDGRVISGDIPLRLRAGPSIRDEVLDLIPDGTPLSITGRTEASDWLEIRTLDQPRLGWVFAEFVEIFIEFETIPFIRSS